MLMNQSLKSKPEVDVAGAKSFVRSRRWKSSELFCGQRELVIEHEGAEYRLQLTRQGKLILTK